MTLHKYGMRLRGFAPGCQPMDGLRSAEEGAGRYHDFVLYDRMLTDAERKAYDLDYIGEVDTDAKQGI